MSLLILPPAPARQVPITSDTARKVSRASGWERGRGRRPRCPGAAAQGVQDPSNAPRESPAAGPQAATSAMAGPWLGSARAISMPPRAAMSRGRRPDCTAARPGRRRRLNTVGRDVASRWSPTGASVIAAREADQPGRVTGGVEHLPVAAGQADRLPLVQRGRNGTGGQSSSSPW